MRMMLTTSIRLIIGCSVILSPHLQVTSESQTECDRQYPFVWKDISKEEKAERRKLYTPQGPWCVAPTASMIDLVVSEPGGVLMPKAFKKMAEKIYEFPVRPDDVWVVTYPKCGTTLTQEMVWQILHDVDLEGGKESIETRSPYLEMQSLDSSDPNLSQNIEKAIQFASEMASPRVIKTHLPIEMLPPDLLKTAKVVFVARNPKDCCVSFFHHEKLVPNHGFLGTFEEYVDLFLKGRNPMGDYWYHLKSGWERRHEPNLKFFWFEDMKKDLRSVVNQLCMFLDHPLSENKVNTLLGHLHIDNFRENKAVNMECKYGDGLTKHFIRKGKVGDWMEHFSEEKQQEFDQWIEEHTKDTDISFKFS